MYKVETRFNHKGYERGDSTLVRDLCSVETFKTKKAAKAYVDSKLTSGIVEKGIAKDTFLKFTGNSFIAESTGEKYDEYYEFKISKI